MKRKFIDDQPGGGTNEIKSVRPPGGHKGYAVVAVAEKSILAVCKYYGRATELAGLRGGIVVPAALCPKFKYKRRRPKRAIKAA